MVQKVQEAVDDSGYTQRRNLMVQTIQKQLIDYESAQWKDYTHPDSSESGEWNRFCDLPESIQQQVSSNQEVQNTKNKGPQLFGQNKRILGGTHTLWSSSSK